MHPEEIRIKIEKLGHTITNIWKIKQYRTKLPFSMFFVELEPALNDDILLNVKTVKDMDTSKIIVTSNQDAPNE
jgi:hypothetical protein